MINKEMKSITSGYVWEKAYSLDNYYVQDVGSKKGLCVIYFSSSAIYYPNTNEELEKRIVKEDYYEWKNNLIREADRNIFVRDICKQFYIYGISEKYSTIDQVIDLLKELTKGYEVITVGSSAGGYMAALVGALLGARCVYCFSAFFSLNNVDQEVWYLLNREKDNPLYNKYYEIYDYIKWAKCTHFFYVFPGLSEDKINNDSIQCGFVDDLDNVHVFKMKEKEHGICMYPYVLKEYLNLNYEKLIEISRREHGSLISKFIFSIYIVGIGRSIRKFIVYKIKGLLKKGFYLYRRLIKRR